MYHDGAWSRYAVSRDGVGCAVWRAAHTGGYIQEGYIQEGTQEGHIQEGYIQEGCADGVSLVA